MPYFDSTATTKPSDEVLALYEKINKEYWYNISSQYKTSAIGANLLSRASNQIFEALKVNKKQIIYTSGATEANNLAIYGIANKFIDHPMHIITTSVEHASVLNCFKDLETKGFKVTYLPINEDGIINITDLEKAITNDTVLVSIMWVNNIIGSIMPIKEVIDVCKKNPRLKLHIDAVQGIGKITNDFSFNDIDMLTISAHKIHGMKGTGLLVLNDNIDLCHLIKGGHQQNNLRPGTVDLAGSVCAAVALKNALMKTEEQYQYVNKLYQIMIDELKDYPNISINRSLYHYSPYIVSITFHNIKAETVMHYLESFDIYVGIGSACNEKTKVIEPTIAFYQNDKMAINTIRVSLASTNTIEEVKLLIEKIKEIGNK